MEMNSKGFTLIELMMVVSIVGILAAIAVPNFLTYHYRAKDSEGLVLAGSVRQDIVDFYGYTGRFPANNNEAGLPSPEKIKGKYVESIAVIDGAIHIKYDEKAYGSGGGGSWETLSIQPALLEDNPTGPVLWIQDGQAPSFPVNIFGKNNSKKRELKKDSP